MTTTAAADGAVLAYEVIGDGEPGPGETFVLVHGITQCGAAWDPVIGLLAPVGPVLTVDLRGHGASERRPPYDLFTMAGDLDAVLRAVGVDDALLIGHSLGGLVVSAYAAAGYPARGIVNVDQPLEAGGFKEMLATVEPMLRGTKEQFDGLVERMFALLDGPLPDSERARLRTVSSPEQEVMLGVWDLVLTTNADDLAALTDGLARAVTLPYLALHGSDAPGYEEWLTARVPHATYETWPDHGHYPHLVDPDRFVARIEAFDGEL
ncbi:MAG TPA: alpha/beta hydrolase [Acidimicrobiia bacterium]